jgi:hypothetical protein
MKPLLFLAADCANVTGDGKLNVMGVFNDINAINFPARHPSMHLVAKLGLELGEHGQRRAFTVILMDADANHIMELSGEFDVPTGQGGRKPEVNIILELKDVVLPKPGRYAFVLLVDKEQKDELTLYVNQIQAPRPLQE